MTHRLTIIKPYSYWLAAVAAGLILLAAPAAARAADTAKVVIPPTLTISSTVTMSQCVFCHGSNLDGFRNPILYFKHDPHLGRGIRCEGCHTGFPHKQGSTVKPSMTLCFNCHNLPHSGNGTVASGACSLCHPNGYGQPPVSHSNEFKAKTHAKDAKKDAFPCRTCHVDDMCASCHTARAVKPKDHANVVTWKKNHGKARDDAQCQTCHTKEFCLKCHVTPMPHPTQWEGEHKSTAKTMKEDCRVCHSDTVEECSSCHHQFKGETLLVEKNCAECHDEYAAPLSQLISAEPKQLRRESIIIHKAHFEMTKTDPFECNECHGREFQSAKGCFTFELCYTCHGRMRGGSLIAKWGGQELCYRCHATK
jgi:hypothetical protein